MKTNITPFLTLAVLFVSLFAQAQTITSFAPSGASVGSIVTVTGSGLGSPTAFTIGGVDAIILSNNGTTLKAMVMPNATTGAVSITTGSGMATSANTFVVLPAYAPDTQQGAKLVGTGGVGISNQAYSVAISADGNTAAVGGFSDNSNIGAVWIYTRSGGVWAQQGAKLVGTGATGAAYQGRDVALSADGNTVVSGGYADNNGQGALWVFVRTGSTWAQQGSKIVCTGDVGDPYLGEAVAISADGNTIAAGSGRDDGYKGATWVFTRSAGTWAQQGSKLVGTSAIGNANQGISVALSATGNTLICGGSYDNSEIGAAWVFTRSAGVWTQEGGKITGTGVGTQAQFGRTVALSADGNTAALGGIYDNGYRGAAWVFTRSAGTWAQQGTKLVATDGVGTPYFGVGLAISADGNTLVAGGSADSNPAAGATWVFKRTGSTWAQSGLKRIGTGNTGAGNQGISVAISADGNTFITGGYTDNTNIGAAWVFTHPTPTLYVDANIGASGNGETFGTAFKTLDEALVSAWNNPVVTRINVASGMYKPTRKPYNADGSNIVTADVRDNTFHVRGDLALYGGYNAATGLRTEAPFGGSGGAILNGDINGDDAVTGTAASLAFANNSENLYHVMLTVAASTTPVTTIDGFTVRGGNGNAGTPISLLGNDVYKNRGAGLLCIKGKQNIKNMTFVHNTNTYGGGAVMVENGINTLQNNVLSNNKAVEGGGLACFNSTDSLLTNTFTGNYGSIYGGGARLINGTIVLTSNVFTNNAGGDGGGFSTNNTALTVTDNTFTTNTATSYGGAYDINHNNCIISRNISMGNTAVYGGGGEVYNVVNTTVTDNVFKGNNSIAEGGGLYVRVTTGQFNNNVFDSNTSDVLGAGLYLYSGTNSLFNNTFYNNNAVTAGGGLYVVSGINTITNTIFYNNQKNGNATAQGADFHISSGSLRTFTNNLLQLATANYPLSSTGSYGIGTAASGTLFEQNPNFVNATDADGVDDVWRTADDGLRLGCSSPAYNTGLNTGAPTLDILGNGIFDATKDMGAYEAQTAVSAPVISIAGITTGAGSVSLTANSTPAATSFVWSSGTTPTTAANSFTTLGTYTVTVTATTAGGCTASTTVSVTVTYPCPTTATIYVDANIAASGNGTSFAQAYKTLDEALTAAWICPIVTRINVANGTYIPTRKPYNADGSNIVTADAREVTFHLRDGLSLYGGYDPTTGLRLPSFGATAGGSGSILSGDIGTIGDVSDNACHVVIAKGTTSGRIDGFTITKGNANVTSTLLSGIFNRNGGGLCTYNASLTLKNNYFTQNTAESEGGGLYLATGTFTFDDNIIDGNTAAIGGGAILGTVTISSGKRNIFINNVANAGFGGGGAFYAVASTILLENNLFVSNTGANGGAIYNDASTLTLTNSTIYNNSAANAGGIYNDGNLSCTAVIFNNNKKSGSSTVAGSDYFNDASGRPTFISCLLQRAITNYTTTVSGSYALGTGADNNYGAYPPNFVNPTDPNGADNIWRTADDGLVLGCGSAAYNRAFVGITATTDILGNAVFGSYKDIGAYELQYDPALPTAGISQTTTGCGTVSLAANGGTTYTWSGGSSTNTAANTFSASATYTVTVTNSVGCTATSTKAVVVAPLPTINAVANQAVCAGSNTEAVTFGGTVAPPSSGGGYYAWTNDNTAIGLGASGTGDIAAFAATNSTAVPITATITATPTNAAVLGYAYIPNINANTVSVVNLATNAVVATINVGTNPNGVAISPDGSTVYITNSGDYVANTGSNNISVISTATNTVTATINVGANPAGVVISPDGSRLYVANTNSNNVSVINIATNSIITTISVGTKPFGVAISPSGGAVYVVNSNDNTVSVISTASNTVTATVGTGFYPFGITASGDGSKVYITNLVSNTISVINTASNSVSNTIPVGTTPYNIAVSPDGSKAYVANLGSNTVSVIDAVTNTVTATIAVLAKPYNVAIDPTTNKVYVTNFGANRVSVIDPSTNTVSGTVTVGLNPAGFGNFIRPSAAVCTGTARTFTVTVNPTPTPYTVTGGGVRCASAGGLTIGVSNSQTGVDYQLQRDGADVIGAVASGTGAAISYGVFPQSDAGTYSVVATNITTNCTGAMANSVAITLAPDMIPIVYIASSDADNYIVTGTSVTFTAYPVRGGATPAFQWYKGATPVGTNSDTYTDATLVDGDVITCVLTSSELCAIPIDVTSTGITMTVVAPCSNATLYVDANIAASGNGVSFGTAYKTLDEALAEAWVCPSVTTINVATGVYKPTRKPYNASGAGSVAITTADDRDKTFHIRNGLVIMGGFDAATGVRLPSFGGTGGGSILSGDFNDDDVVAGSGASLVISNNSENAYHVVTSVSDNATTELDGFTIQGGNADGTDDIMVESSTLYQGYGGGLFVAGGGMKVLNCDVYGNDAAAGGGVYANNTNANFNNTIFYNNSSSGYAGGIYNYAANTTLTTCVLYGNNSALNGGAVFNQNANATFISTTIVKNASGNVAKAIANNGTSSPTLKNCIVYGNIGLGDEDMETLGSGTPTVTYSIIGSASVYAGVGNSNANPLFTNLLSPKGGDNTWRTADDGLRVKCASPAINTGTNADAGDDLIGNGIFETIRDMGAYERQTTNTCGIYTSGDVCAAYNIMDTDFNTWTNLYDADGNIIAALNPLLNDLTNINVNITNEGSAVVDDGMPRLGRAIEVTSSGTPPSSDYILRLYYKNSELDNYNNDNGTSYTKGNLDVVHKSTGNGCLFSDYTDATFGRVANSSITASNYLDGFYVEFRLNHFTIFGATGTATPLPVTWLGLSAQRTGANTATVTWRTASEQNVSHFVVERSTDGVRFTKINQTAAHNSTTGSTYSINDNKLIGGTYYYRIMSVDFDGKTDYSNVVSLVVKGTTDTRLYPNPTTDIVNIATTNRTQNVTVSDAVGRIVFAADIVPSGIDLSAFANGVYVVRVGEEVFKVIKD